VGVVVPHAGLVYSGPIAAWSFKALFEDGRPDSFVIIGPNHTGLGSGVSLFPEGSWQTPLGDVPIDEDLAGAILDDTRIIDPDTKGHAYEHSVEVQLPFLQCIFGEFKFVPICMRMQDLGTAREVGQEISRAIRARGQRTVVIASSDFSHYVPANVAQEKDSAAIARILDLDAPGLIRTVDEMMISMCGPGPVAATIEAVAEMGATGAELLKYATSGDIVPMGDVVGYASITFARD
jgi:AmmeMemoRadiSam system protein B